VDQEPHFSVTVTSPIKGCHATLKRYLQRGSSDLKGVYNRLVHFWTTQHANIKSTSAQEQLRPKHSINLPLFAIVKQHVHAFALLKILQEQTKLPARNGQLDPSYTCTIQKAISLPCYHTIWERKRGNGVILLEDIHPH
jgi:hypothetical protein